MYQWCTRGVTAYSAFYLRPTATSGILIFISFHPIFLIFRVASLEGHVRSLGNSEGTINLNWNLWHLEFIWLFKERNLTFFSNLSKNYNCATEKGLNGGAKADLQRCMIASLFWKGTLIMVSVLWICTIHTGSNDEYREIPTGNSG